MILLSNDGWKARHEEGGSRNRIWCSHNIEVVSESDVDSFDRNATRFCCMLEFSSVRDTLDCTIAGLNGCRREHSGVIANASMQAIRIIHLPLAGLLLCALRVLSSFRLVLAVSGYRIRLRR